MKKPLFIAVSGACIAALTAGTAVFTAAHKTIDLDIDGNISQVTTFSGSVEKLLAEQGVALAAGDVVAPATDSVLKEGSEVVVRYQREVTLEREGELETLKTTALDADELLTTMENRGEEVNLVASRSNDRVSLDLRLNTNGPIAILVDGENTVLDGDHGGLQDILTNQDVELGELDRVSVRALPVGASSIAPRDEEEEQDGQESKDSAKNETESVDPASSDEPAESNMGAAELNLAAQSADEPTMVTLVVQRVEVSEDVKSKKLDFETITKNDANRFKDQGTLVQTEGSEGERVTKFTVTTVDGVEESREEISDEVVTEPVDRVLVVGTKARPVVKPAPKAAPRSSGSSSSSSGSPTKSSGSAASGDVWAALARCESGGRANAVSASGAYHGLYQFSVATWKSVGGSGLPSQASAAEQTQRAKALQARSGWGQWPSCSKQIGVR